MKPQPAGNQFAAFIGIDSGRCQTRSFQFVHLLGVRASFHIQTLRPPKMMQASTLGHNGIGCPATSTSGRITSRTNCAMAIRPNTTLATRNPVICEFMVSSFLNAPAPTPLRPQIGRTRYERRLHLLR
jgi:hypothetical protein